MSYMRKEFMIENTAERVWEAVRDFAAVHQALAPGFVTDTHVEGDRRIVTFAGGAVAHERLVSLDEDARRVAYTVVGGSLTPEHHHASMQVFAVEPSRCLFVWIVDVLPQEIAGPLAGMVEAGARVIKETLDIGAAPAA
ncbi:SRPBCC family protein [Streptomyces sp. NPDC059918]|uniref:SRPBCC family protein n=1 Tax=unclassified Streptomyces TaxID=2593676 RepID=UPI003659A6EE